MSLCSLTGSLAPILLLAPLVALGEVEPTRGCAAKETEHGRRLVRSLDVEGVSRQFIVDVPKSVRPGVAVPLLFDFHGFNHSGEGVWQVSDFKALAEQRGFITVYPTGLPITIQLLGRQRTGPGWKMENSPDNRDLAFTRAMLADLDERYCIDPKRIFSTGFSNGAFFSTLLGCTMSDRFAAVAPVGGGPIRGGCSPSRPVPVMIHHGRRDELIELGYARLGRDLWIEANGCDKTDAAPALASCQTVPGCAAGAAVVYCEGDYAHSWPPGAAAQIWNFFEKHPRQE